MKIIIYLTTSPLTLPTQTHYTSIVNYLSSLSSYAMASLYSLKQFLDVLRQMCTDRQSWSG